MTRIPINSTYLTQTLSELVAIDSSNPSLSAQGAGEAEIAAYVAEACRKLGLDVEIVLPENLAEDNPQSSTDSMPRPSVVAMRTGRGGGKSLMLNAHMDTVGVAGMDNPFTPQIRDGRLFGRGAQDMKGSLAACLAAIKAVQDADLHLRGDLLLAAVADEEYASIGTQAVIQKVQVDAAIVTEPTDLQIGMAHRGFAWLEVETLGKAAHGSRWQEGIDANRMMGHVLLSLDALEQELLNGPRHALLGPPSLHVSLLQGGDEPSIYAAHCQATIERRTLPGESGEYVLGQVQQRLDALAQSNPNFQAHARLLFEREAFEARPDSTLVPALERGYAQAVGKPAPHAGITFWTDAALLAAAGADTILIGPTGGGLHSAVEWVDLLSCVTLAGILAETAADYCG